MVFCLYVGDMSFTIVILHDVCDDVSKKRERRDEETL